MQDYPLVHVKSWPVYKMCEAFHLKLDLFISKWSLNWADNGFGLRIHQQNNALEMINDHPNITNGCTCTHDMNSLSINAFLHQLI